MRQWPCRWQHSWVRQYEVKSWVGDGSNMPISAEDIKKALGYEKLKELAASTGIPVDKAAEYLAQHLPTAIDKATPGGVVPPNAP